MEESVYLLRFVATAACMNTSTMRVVAVSAVARRMDEFLRVETRFFGEWPHRLARKGRLGVRCPRACIDQSGYLVHRDFRLTEGVQRALRRLNTLRSGSGGARVNIALGFARCAKLREAVLDASRSMTPWTT